MATYVNLIKLTDQGIQNYKETVGRAEKYWATIKGAGGRLIQEVWTLGEYDCVVLFEAPDDETASAVAFQVGSLGNVRTTTLRAFTPDEMRKLIAKTSS